MRRKKNGRRKETKISPKEGENSGEKKNGRKCVSTTQQKNLLTLRLLVSFGVNGGRGSHARIVR